jgi:hypothetical protein
MPVGIAEVTRRTLGRNCHIGVQSPGIPGQGRQCYPHHGILVARIAVGRCYTSYALIRNVICWFAIGMGIGSSVTHGALVGHRHLRVVPLGSQPTIGRTTGVGVCGVVTRSTVVRCGKVRS